MHKFLSRGIINNHKVCVVIQPPLLGIIIDSDGAWKETKSFSQNIDGSLSTSSLDDGDDDDDDENDFPDDDEFDFLSTNTSNSKSYRHRHRYQSSDSDSEFDYDDATKVIMANNKNRIGNAKKPPNKEEKTRILYIQMEYCEKQTLKDIIDVGVKPDDGWR